MLRLILYNVNIITLNVNDNLHTLTMNVHIIQYIFYLINNIHTCMLRYLSCGSFCFILFRGRGIDAVVGPYSLNRT